MRSATVNLFPAILLLLFSACNSTPSQLIGPAGYSSGRQGFVARHQRKARQFEADNALNEALREWQLINTVAPGTSGAGGEIARLIKEIENAFRQQRTAAEQAARQHRFKTSKLHLLKALAMKPDDRSTIDELRAIERRWAYASLDASPQVSSAKVSEVDAYTAVHDQSDSEQPDGKRVVPPQSKQSSVLSSPKSADENIRRGLKHLSRQEYDAALHAFTQARKSSTVPNKHLDDYIAQTRRALAEQHYERGVVAFRGARYGDAVTEFELALSYAPSHHKARFYHSSAKSLSTD